MKRLCLENCVGEGSTNGSPSDDSFDFVYNDNIMRRLIYVLEYFIQVLALLHLAESDHVFSRKEFDTRDLGFLRYSYYQSGFS